MLEFLYQHDIIYDKYNLEMQESMKDDFKEEKFISVMLNHFVFEHQLMKIIMIYLKYSSIKWGRERSHTYNIAKNMRTSNKLENSWFEREEKDIKHKLYTTWQSVKELKMHEDYKWFQIKYN
jgi:predicted membrane protein